MHHRLAQSQIESGLHGSKLVRVGLVEVGALAPGQKLQEHHGVLKGLHGWDLQESSKECHHILLSRQG
eukprot:9722368-Lingulodinium_polyedra.AAC.1